MFDAVNPPRRALRPLGLPAFTRRKKARTAMAVGSSSDGAGSEVSSQGFTHRPHLARWCPHETIHATCARLPCVSWPTAQTDRLRPVAPC